MLPTICVAQLEFFSHPRGGERVFFKKKIDSPWKAKKSKILKTSHILNFLPNRRVYGVRRVDDTSAP